MAGLFAWYSLEFVILDYQDGIVAFRRGTGLDLRGRDARWRSAHRFQVSDADLLEMIWLLVIGLLLAAVAGAPLFAVLMGAAMVGFIAADIPLAVVAIEVYRIVDTPLLVALPLFTYAGYVLAEAKTSERLVNLVQSVFGALPSGLALVGFVACALFTALTGASGVTIVALGALLLPALKSAGYSDRFSLGLVTTSGSLGLLLVPSVPLILYGIVAQQMDVGEPLHDLRTLSRRNPAAAVDAWRSGCLHALAPSRGQNPSRAILEGRVRLRVKSLLAGNCLCPSSSLVASIRDISRFPKRQP